MTVDPLASGFGNIGFATPPERALSSALGGLQHQVREVRRAKPKPVCVAHRTSAQNLASGVVTIVTWQAAAENFTGYNGTAMWTSGATADRIVVPSEYVSDWWDITVSARFQNVGAVSASRRFITVHINGTNNADIAFRAEVSNQTSNGETVFTVSRPLKLAASSTIFLTAYQDSGAFLSLGGTLGGFAPWECSMTVALRYP